MDGGLKLVLGLSLSRTNENVCGLLFSTTKNIGPTPGKTDRRCSEGTQTGWCLGGDLKWLLAWDDNGRRTGRTRGTASLIRRIVRAARRGGIGTAAH